MSVKFIREKTKEELLEIIKNSHSKQEVLRNCGVTQNNSVAKNYLTNFIKEENPDISHFTMGRPLYTRYTLEQIKELVEKNICWTDLMSDMGIRFVGNNIQTVKKLISYYDISVNHFDAKKAAAKNHSKTRKVADIFCENSDANRSTVKNRILSLNLIPYKCSGPQCTITDTWNGQPIVLHLEHKNGIGNDNRLDNLCFLCPNCHSQTSTYAGRNVQGKKRAIDGSFITS